jgi:hypothetical protein
MGQSFATRPWFFDTDVIAAKIKHISIYLKPSFKVALQEVI